MTKRKLLLCIEKFTAEKVERKRVAIVFEGDVNNRLGVFNAVINRVLHLNAVSPELSTDVHMIQVYDGKLMCRLRGTTRLIDRPSEITAMGVQVKVHWFKRCAINAVCHRLCGREPMITRFLSHLADEMNGYGAIIAHDRYAAVEAAIASRRYGMPHFITWHGTSVHTEPTRDPMIMRQTRKLMQGACANFFVSKALETLARDTITAEMRADVLYNGANSDFREMTEEERKQLRLAYNIPCASRVVTFVGRFEPVKNVILLPTIFAAIKQKSSDEVFFMTIGDGEQYSQVNDAMTAAGVDCLMLGAKPSEEMPALLNCTDLLVLPSSREGMPLVVIEALQCGANVVASDVGGIAEAIGRENVVALGDNFEQRIARRAVEVLNGRVSQHLPSEISWVTTAQKESVYLRQTD